MGISRSSSTQFAESREGDGRPGLETSGRCWIVERCEKWKTNSCRDSKFRAGAVTTGRKWWYRIVEETAEKSVDWSYALRLLHDDDVEKL